MRNAFTLPLLLASAGLYAQPTIEQFTFVPGTAILLDAEFPITSEGASGANVTWDLSTLTFSSAQYTYTARTVASIPGANKFPDATGAYAVDLTQGITGYYFYNYSGGFSEHGEVIAGNGPDLFIPYSDPVTYCTTPIAFGNSGLDKYASTSLITTMNSSTTGDLTWNVDAYGTLKLPNATYTHVLRVHSVAKETIITTVAGAPITTKSQEESWRWFKAGCPLPLLTYSLVTDDSGTEPGSTVALISMNGTNALDEGALPTLNEQANPTSGTCMVSFPGAMDRQVRLLNATSQVVLEQALKGVAPTFQLPFTGYAPGAYILEARSRSGIQHTRIIHQ